jgi:hypothetical protein
MKLVQEIRAYAEMATRHPPERVLARVWRPIRSDRILTALRPRRRFLKIQAENPCSSPSQVKIIHLAAQPPNGRNARSSAPPPAQASPAA